MAKKNKNESVEQEKVETSTEAAETEEQSAPTEEQPSAVEQELAELKDSYLRVMAEYDNFRKRTAKEREQLFTASKASVVDALLPVYDNLERAVAQETSDEAYKKGVEMTLAQFVSALEGIGVKMIASERGSAFDPEKHNAVMHVEDESFGAGVIVETFQKGFETDGRVIRHAVVKVAN